MNWSPENETKRTRGSTPSLTTTEATCMKEVGLTWRQFRKDASTHNRRAPIILSLHKPRRDGIITQKMSDPNLTNNGYRSQEFSFSKCKDFRSLLAQLKDQRPPTVPGDHEEDPAKTGPRIRLRARSIFILPRRERRTRPSPVAGGQTPRC